MADADLEVTPPDNQEPQRPEWLPDNFKDETAFAASYKELQRTLTARSEREKELENQVSNYETILAQQQQAQQPANTDWLYQQHESDPVGTTAWMIQQGIQAALSNAVGDQLKPVVQTQNTLLAQQTDAILAQQVPDWAEQKPNVVEYVKQNPYLVSENAFSDPNTAANAMLAAYKAMNYDAREAQSQSQAEQYKAEMETLKQQAQTQSGAPGRPEPTDADKDYWDSVVNAKTNRYQ